MQAVKKCEKKLAKMHNAKYCFLTGRGSTALWISFLLVNKNRKKIILPNIICPSVLFSVILAKCEPVFIDVLESDSTLDPKKVKKMLIDNNDIGAVVIAHLYGHPSSILELKDICKQKKIILIEDVAQSLAGRYSDNSFLGTKGDISIFSFGYSKILDVGNGGAILTNNSKFASRIKKINNKILINTYSKEKISELYKELYYLISNRGKKNKKFYELFDFFPHIFRNFYINKISNSTAILINESLKNLSSEVHHRKKIANIYYQGLKNNKNIKLFTTIGPGISWRFSFRVNPLKRDKMLYKIRKNGYDASSWYPCVNKFSEIGRVKIKQDLRVSKIIEKEIVNIWVTKDYSPKKAKQLVSCINKIL